MRKTSKLFSLLAAVALSMVSRSVWADAAATPAATVAATAAATPVPPTIAVGGMVDSYFSYNFANSAANVNGAGNKGYWYNSTDSTYTLGLAEVKATATQGQGSAHVVLAYGEEASLAIGAAPGIDVLQAYVSYNPGQWTFNAGRFVTWMGYEVIESNSNWNYSHSLLFNQLPYWHTGLSVNFAPSSTFGITGYITDGSNAAPASPYYAYGKTGGLEVAITPNSQWTITLNGIMGPQAGNLNATYAGEGIVVFKPDATWSFALDAQYGGADKIAVAAMPTSMINTSYFGVALYGRYQIQSDWAVALRLETLNDSDDSLAIYSAVPGLVTNGVAAVANEGTLTVEHNFTANLLMRLEGRMDMASYNGSAANIFAGKTSSQTTGTASMVFNF